MLLRARYLSRAARCIAFAAFVALLWGCAESVALPDDFKGNWVTRDSRYSGRHLGLSAERIVIGVGDGRNESHAVEAVYREHESGKRLYRIMYRTRYGEDSLLLYRKGDGIVLASRPDVVWVRGESER